MKKLLSQHQIKLEVLIHCISWIIVFSFPLLVSERNTEVFNWNRFIHHMMVTITFMIVFYANYFIFIPKYLFNEKAYQYILLNILLISALAILLYIWRDFGSPNLIPNPERPKFSRQKPPPHSPWIFIARDFVGIIFTIGLSLTVRISKRWNKVETARREAEKSRTEAELKNLRNQLNPHFLLNTLNNIYALIAFDTEKAQQAVQELSKLLRHMLYDNQQDFVPLNREAEFIRNYIELMRIRLANHVTVKTDIQISKNSHTLITPLIFISLIENAFKHGISPTETSYVYISLFEEHGSVTCEIINSNFPKSNKDQSGSGIGLPQVSKRLELIYPGRYIWEKGVRKDSKEYFSRLRIDTNSK